ncbi:unnamed protein product, partial [Allacma fusca]
LQSFVNSLQDENHNRKSIFKEIRETISDFCRGRLYHRR